MVEHERRWRRNSVKTAQRRFAPTIAYPDPSDRHAAIYVIAFRGIRSISTAQPQQGLFPCPVKRVLQAVRIDILNFPPNRIE